jgi:hypothetical protein
MIIDIIMEDNYFMSAYIKSMDSLILACTTEIHYEFHQIRLRISTEEIYRLADSLLKQDVLEWPLLLVELQKGKSLKRLLDHLNLQIKVHGFSFERPLTFKGPFPTLSLRSLKDVVDEHRSTLQVARCVEFLGNKAWNYSLKLAAKRALPFQANVASLTLKNLGCSTKQQVKMALLDLSRRIKGCILNFLHDWEELLVKQTCEQLLIIKKNVYSPITETAV